MNRSKLSRDASKLFYLIVLLLLIRRDNVPSFCL